MTAYHDAEWGVPVHDDRTHFEFLVLEAAQAGLSWSIVLKKREGYRRAFSEFDPAKVARYTPARMQKLTADPAIVRNRMKIEAAVQQRARVSRGPGGVRQLRRLLLAVRRRPAPRESLEDDAGDSGHLTGVRRVQQGSEARGFSFVGSTIVYAHMQAVGMVNDHLVRCFRYRETQRR